jgi:predicted nucleic acid-binding protein
VTPPSVLLDESFLIALLDRDHAASDAAHQQYAELLDQFERHELRLRSRHDHLDRHGSQHRRTILAPVERVHVAGQHRRAAKRLDLPFEVDHDVAVTLVIMRRERIDRVASFHPVFETLDVTLHR